MKKLVVVFLSLVLLSVGVSAACAVVQAKDALIAYVGTEAFTKLNAGERQACVEWLAEGGAMGPECKKAVMSLIALSSAPVLLLMSRRLVKKQKAFRDKMMKSSSDIYSFETEAMYGIDTI